MRHIALLLLIIPAAARAAANHATELPASAKHPVNVLVNSLPRGERISLANLIAGADDSLIPNFNSYRPSEILLGLEQFQDQFHSLLTDNQRIFLRPALAAANAANRPTESSQSIAAAQAARLESLRAKLREIAARFGPDGDLDWEMESRLAIGQGHLGAYPLRDRIVVGFGPPTNAQNTHILYGNQARDAFEKTIETTQRVKDFMLSVFLVKRLMTRRMRPVGWRDMRKFAEACADFFKKTQQLHLVSQHQYSVIYGNMIWHESRARRLSAFDSLGVKKPFPMIEREMLTGIRDFVETMNSLSQNSRGIAQRLRKLANRKAAEAFWETLSKNWGVGAPPRLDAEKFREFLADKTVLLDELLRKQAHELR